jgi:GGDEF domain-containing protein
VVRGSGPQVSNILARASESADGIVSPAVSCRRCADPEIAEKIRCRAAEPIEVPGNAIRATLRIGATIARPGEPVDSITARADAAMYQAKSGDRNTVTQA